jgi:hypothetical protein
MSVETYQKFVQKISDNVKDILKGVSTIIIPKDQMVFSVKKPNLDNESAIK